MAKWAIFWVLFAVFGFPLLLVVMLKYMTLVFGSIFP